MYVNRCTFSLFDPGSATTPCFLLLLLTVSTWPRPCFVRRIRYPTRKLLEGIEGEERVKFLNHGLMQISIQYNCSSARTIDTTVVPATNTFWSRGTGSTSPVYCYRIETQDQDLFPKEYQVPVNRYRYFVDKLQNEERKLGSGQCPAS